MLADAPPELAGVGAGVLATTQQVALARVGTLGSLFLTLGRPVAALRCGPPW